MIEDFRRIKQPRLVESGDEREAAILKQICTGKSNRSIAQALGLAKGTVKNYVSNILTKLHARSRTDLVARAGK